MTQAEIKLCSLLLREHFGEIVERVGTLLVRAGAQPLRMLVGDTGLSLEQVKKALCVLLQHNLATFQLQKRGAVEYEARGERVLRILRYPRYIYAAKTLYGDTGELLVEELLLNGKMTMSAAVRKVADRLTETMEDGRTMEYADVSSTFVRLADTHLVRRCPLLPEAPQGPAAPPAPAPTLVLNEKDTYAVPRLNLTGRGKRRRSCDEEEDGGRRAKKQKQDAEGTEPPPDDGIYWQVNLERFHQHFRDQAIVSAVANRMDQTSSEIVRTMLRMSEVTTSSGAPYTQPLSSNEVRARPVGAASALLALRLIFLCFVVCFFFVFFGCFFPPPSRRSSGRFQPGTTSRSRFWTSTSPCSLTTRSSSWANRGTAAGACTPSSQGSRLSGHGHPGVHRRGEVRVPLRQDIPPAPAQEALGAEAGGGLRHDPGQGGQGDAVQDAVRELRGPAGDSQDAGPRALAHLLPLHGERPVRRAHAAAPLLQERGQPDGAAPVRDQGEQRGGFRPRRRLLEKSQRVEAILASMQATGAEAAQLQEIEEMITAPERQQLENLKRNVNKLDASENQVDETIFVLESFIDSTVKKP
ncbi:DNA-directed RNA polymerase III subunit RPC3 isoform X2 [Cygnus olor]|uniref:DNA-directed RNA polymerase III subunit RPC3 isoform X2 n=1 Tax=Cygnus olor TaxID=8869 RepID=UPI001ADEB2B3|nr:DNA-directed RNA polymerase III subunit RPC3 isoform X2 [Cygnus olor]